MKGFSQIRNVFVEYAEQVLHGNTKFRKISKFWALTKVELTHYHSKASVVIQKK